jgi:hypothetical protein
VYFLMVKYSSLHLLTVLINNNKFIHFIVHLVSNFLDNKKNYKCGLFYGSKNLPFSILKAK